MSNTSPSDHKRWSSSKSSAIYDIYSGCVVMLWLWMSAGGRVTGSSRYDQALGSESLSKTALRTSHEQKLKSWPSICIVPFLNYLYILRLPCRLRKSMVLESGLFLRINRSTTNSEMPRQEHQEMYKECNESKCQICQTFVPLGTAGRDSHQDVRPMASRRPQTRPLLSPSSS